MILGSVVVLYLGVWVTSDSASPDFANRFQQDPILRERAKARKSSETAKNQQKKVNLSLPENQAWYSSSAIG